MDTNDMLLLVMVDRGGQEDRGDRGDRGYSYTEAEGGGNWGVCGGKW